MTALLTIKKPIDMTLRMWSDKLALQPYLDQLCVDVQHLHVAGQPIANEGRFAGRVADRHYASIANVTGNDGRDVLAWFVAMIELVGQQRDLKYQLLIGQIEALLWITIFGQEIAAVPSIDCQTVASCASLGLNIMVENYTDLDHEGVPIRIWLTPA